MGYGRSSTASNTAQRKNKAPQQVLVISQHIESSGLTTKPAQAHVSINAYRGGLTKAI
jgi:hypothetical protein